MHKNATRMVDTPIAFQCIESLNEPRDALNNHYAKLFSCMYSVVGHN
jgi:hypothetical protein